MQAVERIPSPPPRWAIPGAAALLVGAGVAAYANSFSGAFVFDDFPSIVDNPSIRHLWPPAGWLHPPGYAATVENRIVLNLSFALNYAFSGGEARGYHLVNLIIHLGAALTVFGLVRRTVVRLGRTEMAGTGFALVVSLIWELHPLQTESVTYLVQRAESLAGLFQLLTLYGFVRAEGTRGPVAQRWRLLSVGACLAGMGAKETMVTAPVIVLAYDACFCAGSVGAALRRQPRYYLGLAAAWIPLAILLRHGGRTTVFGGQEGVTLGQYWLTQPGAIVHYLRLAVWPHPQVLDYGAIWVRSVREVVGPAGILLLVGGATALAWVRMARTHRREGRALGFLGLCFLAWLAVTTVAPSPRQTLAEHRMYLALLPVVTVLAWGGAAVLGRFRRGRGAGALAAGLVLSACGWTTWQRNRDYASELTLFAHDAAAEPNNPQALANFGGACAAAGRLLQAESMLTEALRLRPEFPVAQLNLAGVEGRFGRKAEAEAHYRRAIAGSPDSALMRLGLFEFLVHQGRVDEAMRGVEPWLKARPGHRVAFDQEARDACARGQFDVAEALGRVLVASYPLDPELRHHLDLIEAAAAAASRPQRSAGGLRL